MKYNTKVVTAYFKEMGIPEPYYEYEFCPERKWRFDISWPFTELLNGGKISGYVALEVQGGIWRGGRHTNGAALLKEWEKLNTAAALGWRILYCQPTELCMNDTAQFIKQALNIHEPHTRQQSKSLHRLRP
jgi:hypothetical protein